MLVSVVIPTHNRAPLLKRALDSVLNQSYKDLEVIVVDDASTDNTPALLKDLQTQDARLKVITNQTSLRGAQSRNRGIDASTGTWIAFLDDDDIWHPDKLQQQLKALKHHPYAVASTCDYRVHYPLKVTRHVKPPTRISYLQLLRSNTLGGASVCICSAAALKTIGGFDKHLRSSQDWDLWLRLREQGEIISVASPLVEYQVHFNYRISNDMRAKYLGARRFYFKYKKVMDTTARLQNLSFICFIQSRQTQRPLRHRWQKLMMALKNSPRRTGVSYLLSSLPRMLGYFI